MNKLVLRTGVSMLAAAVLFTTSCKKEVESSFIASKMDVKVGENIVLTDQGETGKKAVSNLSYVYDMGNEDKVSGVVASYNYNKAGTYTVSQIITNNDNLEKGHGKVGTSSITINVTAVVAAFNISNAAPNTGQTVFFTNTTVDDKLGFEPYYEWEVLSNGIPQSEPYTTTNGHGLTYTNLYGKNFSLSSTNTGEYTVRLTAFQGSSETEIEQTITVGGSATTADDFSNNLVGTWNVNVKGSFSGAAYDANTGCNGGLTPSIEERYEVITFGANGDATSVKPTKESEATSGNFVQITLDPTGDVLVSSNIFDESNTLGINDSNLWQIETNTATEITLVRTATDEECNDKDYEDEYTITLTK